MLNISEEFSNFSSINLESVEQKIGKIPDDMKQSIELYNRALEEIGNKNEDIALIALKKAISIYPAFYEAMNLMGVCYVSLDDKENARMMFNRVIQMDDNSIRALHYLDAIDGSGSSENGKSGSVKARNTNPAKSNAKTSVKNSAKNNVKNGANAALSLIAWLGAGFSPERKPYYFKYVLGFILGVLAMCLLWLFLPADKPIVLNLSRPVNEAAQIKELKNENLSLNNRLNDAMSALETAKSTEKQLQNQMEQYVKWSAALRDLQNLAEDGKYKEVVTEIEKSFTGLDLPKEIEDEVIALNNTCKPKAIPQFYESAKELYDSNAKAKDPDVYKQSAEEYRMAIRLIEEVDEKPSNMTSIYYYGGKAIALSQSPSKQEAETEAIDCFKAVISAAPGSKLASYAQARINELEAGKAIKH